MVVGSPSRIFSPEVSLTRHPIALADSTTKTMFSSIASLLAAADPLVGIIVRALRSTVLGTDLLISLLQDITMMTIMRLLSSLL